MTMQPSPRPPSAPPAHPVAPEISRGYGWLVLGGALVWAALVALVLIAFGSLLSSLVLAVGEVKTPTPDGERRAEIAGAVGLATGIGALVMLVLSLVLDLAAAVASIGRLDGRRGDRAVPIITLVSVTISLLLPLALAVAALGASLVELTQVTALLIWLLFMVVLVAAPLIRVGQCVAGVIRLITGEPARPTPPPAAHGRFGW